MPAIHPLPEYLAEGRLAADYADMKAVFQVPWMGVVTMAYAYYPSFYATLWKGLRPLCLSAPFVDGFKALRAFCEDRVAALDPPGITSRLTALGYAPREVAQIRAMIEIFSHGNFPYLVIATVLRYLLEVGELSDESQAATFSGRHAPDVSVPFVLMEAHHADAPTQAVYEDVKSTLGLPFVNTDYRALARWPSYFRSAWTDLKGVVGTPAYARVVDDVHARSVALAAALPNVGELRPEALEAAAARDASLEEVTRVCRLFQWLLPGLVTNIAFFRAQLAS